MWFCSYLSDHFQYVRVRSDLSPATLMRYDVPQGSVLGPILFLLYTADLITVLWSFCATVCWWHSDIRFQFTVVSRSAADANALATASTQAAVLTPLPTGCHQIDCSLMPSRQSFYGAHQLGGRINFLLHHSECTAITWRHLHLFETWEYI